MPIVSRVLTKLSNREDLGAGLKKWRVDAVDGRGRPWRHSAFLATQAQAEVVRDTVAFDLANQDKLELLQWVLDRNTVASFDLTGRDITEEQGEDFVMTTFAASPGEEAIPLAWWVESLGPPAFSTIRDRIGWSPAEGTLVQDRAIALLAAEPDFNTTITAP
jgi:hypothetical protein